MNSRISIFPFLLFAFAAAGLSGTAEAGTLRTYYKTPTGTFGGPDASVVDPMTTTTPTQASGKNVTAYPPAGQKLTGWYFYAKSPSGSDQPQGESLGTANPLNVKISEGNDRWLVAHFAWITYKVEYNYAGGSSTGSSSSKLYTDTFNLAAASEKTGYTFGGWKALSVGRTYSAGESVSGEDLCPSDWHEDGKTVTLTAQWSAKTYPVSYQAKNCTLMSSPSTGTYDQPLSIAWVKDDDVAKKSTVTVYDGVDGTTLINSVETDGTTFDFKMSDLGKGYYESVVIKVVCTKNVRHDLTLKKGVGVQAITWQTNNCAWVRSETDVNLPGLLAGTTWAAKVVDADVERGYEGPGEISGTLYANVTRELKGTAHQYAVDYDLQGGEKKSGGHYPSNESFGDGFYVSAPTRTGRTFLGWIVVTNKDDLACAKWGTSADDITHDVFADTPCANGASGDVFFKNLTSINGEKIWLKAKWSGLTRTITVVTDPAEAGSASGGGEIEEGATATLAATPNDGYSFCCWTNSATGLFTNDNPWTFTVTADETYTAVFTGNVYTVYYDARGGEPDETEVEVRYGSAYGPQPEVKKAGYVFKGWNTKRDGTGDWVEPETDVKTADDHDLYAVWDVQTEFDVIFVDKDGGNGAVTNGTRAHTGDWIREPNPLTTNWKFRYHTLVGWNPALPQQMKDKPLEFTAVWWSIGKDILDCTNLDFEATGNWKPVADNKATGGWCMRMEGLSGSDNLTATLSESGTLSFRWKGNPGRRLVVKVDEDDKPFIFSGSSWQEETISVDVDQGASIELNFTCNDDWVYGDFCEIDHVTWTPGAPVETYAVTYDKGAYGTGEGRTDTKTNGVDMVLAGALFTRDNYKQDGWSKNEYGSTSDYALGGTYADDASITLYPHWLENGKYTVFYLKGTGATGSATSQTAHEDETVVLRGAGHFVRTGYSQDGWATSDLGEKAFEFNETYDKNVSTNLYPCWTNNRYTVAFNPNGGSVTPEPKVVTYNKPYGELPTLDDRGDLKFDGWALASGDAVTAETVVKTAADHELIAKWTQDLGPYSKALDCENLKFERVTDGWFVCNETPHKGVSCLRSATSGAELTATIMESGTLTFWWRGKSNDSVVQLVVTGNAEERLTIPGGDSQGWESKAIAITASAEAPVTFKFSCGSRFDGTCDIDDIVWTPEGGGEPTPGEPVAVTEAGVADGVFSLTIPTTSDTDYGVWTNADLTVDSWGLMGEPQKGEGTPLEFSWPILPEFPQLFFRAHKVEYK